MEDDTKGSGSAPQSRSKTGVTAAYRIRTKLILVPIELAPGMEHDLNGHDHDPLIKRT